MKWKVHEMVDLWYSSTMEWMDGKARACLKDINDDALVFASNIETPVNSKKCFANDNKKV